MKFRSFGPDPDNTKLITIFSLAGVVIICYTILISATCLKFRGDLPQPFLLFFLKNYGFCLFLIPLLYVGFARFFCLADETSGDMTKTQEFLLYAFSIAQLLLFALPVIAVVASVRGFSYL
jgi:hypothetical protein